MLCTCRTVVEHSHCRFRAECNNYLDYLIINTWHRYNLVVYEDNGSGKEAVSESGCSGVGGSVTPAGGEELKKLCPECEEFLIMFAACSLVLEEFWRLDKGMPVIFSTFFRVYSSASSTR